MPLNRNGILTVTDLTKATNCGGEYVACAEVLLETNKWLDYVPVVPSNEPMSHIVRLQTSKPTAQFIGFNQGVAPSKGTSVQEREVIGYAKSTSETDKRLKDSYGIASFKQELQRQDKEHIAVVGETMARAFIYGNLNEEIKAFDGLARRYSDPTTGVGAKNILDAGGRNDNCLDIFIAVVGESGLHGVIPRNYSGTHGVEVTDLGPNYIAKDANGNNYPAIGTDFGMYMGIGIEDPRAVVRIANIEQHDLMTATGTQDKDAATNLLVLFARAKARLKPRVGQVVAFVPQQAYEAIAVLAGKQSLNVLKVQDAYYQFTGGRSLSFEETTLQGTFFVQMDVMNDPGAFIPNIPAI